MANFGFLVVCFCALTFINVASGTAVVNSFQYNVHNVESWPIDLFELKSIKFSSLDVDFPALFEVAIKADLRQSFYDTVQLNVTMFSVNGNSEVFIPCYGGFGSCSYPDICKILIDSNCTAGKPISVMYNGTSNNTWQFGNSFGGFDNSTGGFDNSTGGFNSTGEVVNITLSTGNGTWNFGNGTLDFGNGTWSFGNFTYNPENGTLDFGNGTWSFGNMTWDSGNGTWDFGNGTWDFGNGTWDFGNDNWDFGNDNWDFGNGSGDDVNSTLNCDCPFNMTDYNPYDYYHKYNSIVLRIPFLFESPGVYRVVATISSSFYSGSLTSVDFEADISDSYDVYCDDDDEDDDKEDDDDDDDEDDDYYDDDYYGNNSTSTNYY